MENHIKEIETKVKQIINHIDKNITNEISLQSISKEFSISKFHLHRTFKMLTGESMINYVRLRKLTEASFMLLDTDLRIIDISILLCYESQSTFTRAFKKHFKVTPKIYRNKKKDLVMLTKTRLSLCNLHKQSKFVYEIVEMDKLELIGLKYTTTEKTDDYDISVPTIRDNFYNMLCDCSYIPKYHRCFDYSTVNKNSTKENFTWDTFIGIDLNDFIPEKLEVKTIPAAKYICFKHYGELNNLKQTISNIWSIYLPNSDLNIDYRYSLNLYENESLGEYFYPGKPMEKIPYDRATDIRFSNNYVVKILIPLK